MTEKLDSVPLKACAGCGQLYPLNGNGHMCKPTPAADKVGADSVDLESTFGPILKDKFPDYDSLTRFHAAYALAEAAIAALQSRSAEPVRDDEGPCTDCDDTGITIQTERRCSCDAAEPAGEEPVCATCLGHRYLLMAPSTVSAGGERRACPVCTPANSWFATPSNPERLVAGMRAIQHSIAQARIPGNDWRRELVLIESVVYQALSAAPLKEASHDV